jgi:cytoskeletal protein RodZ
MSGFIYKQIHSKKCLKEKLKERRESLGLTLEKISNLTGVSSKYLAILENGDFEKIPGEIYLKQWLKKYCQILELEETEILKDYQKENNNSAKFEPLFCPPQKLKRKKILLNFSPRIFRTIGIGVIIFVFLFYLSWEVKKIIQPPFLEITEPQNLSSTGANKVTIKGKSEPEVSILINNQTVLASPDGKFQQEVELGPGLNVLEISAKKKHSQKNTITLSIISNNEPPAPGEGAINNSGLSLKN